MFHRDTRSKTKQIRQPIYLEHYSVVQLVQKSAKKKKKEFQGGYWKTAGYLDLDQDSSDDEDKSFIPTATDNASYARLLSFPEPFPDYLAHLEKTDVQERLNRSLPVSLWVYLLQPLLKLARIYE